MKFAKTNFCLKEEKQQRQRLEDVISNLAHILPLSQRNGCLKKVDSEYKYKSPSFSKGMTPLNTFGKTNQPPL